MSRKDESYPKEDYDEIIERFQELKGMKLSGSEFKPIQQDIKTMFMNGREKGDIMDLMEWLEENDQAWSKNWNMGTVKKKIPEWVAGNLQEDDKEEKDATPDIPTKMDTSTLKQEIGDFEEWYEEVRSGELKYYPGWGVEDTGIMKQLVESGTITFKGNSAGIDPELYRRFSNKHEKMEELRSRREYAEEQEEKDLERLYT